MRHVDGDRRVVVYGVTGSGKSRLARQLSDASRIPWTDVDAHTLTRRRVCNGNVETFGRVVSSDSIIVWHFRSFRRKRELIDAWRPTCQSARRTPQVAARDLSVARPGRRRATVASLE
jgi:hypothetical protein